MSQRINFNETIQSVHTESIKLDESFIEFGRRFAHLPGTVILLSGGELDCARYHILACHPFLSVTGDCRSLSIQSNEQKFCVG